MAVAAALLLSLTLAACGGDGEDDEGAEPTPSRTGTTSTSAPVATSPDYLPAPDGVELTTPGTRVDLGAPIVGAWEPRQDLVGVVRVTAETVERVKDPEKVFKGFELPDGVRPYFVRGEVVNEGDTDLGGRQLPIYLVDTADALVEASGIARDFEACPGSTFPAVFAPGDSAPTCLVFLLQPQAEPAAVTFRPPEGVVPITWTGEIDTYRAEKGDQPGKKNKKKQR